MNWNWRHMVYFLGVFVGYVLLYMFILVMGALVMPDYLQIIAYILRYSLVIISALWVANHYEESTILEIIFIIFLGVGPILYIMEFLNAKTRILEYVNKKTD